MAATLSCDAYIALMRLRRLDGPLFINRGDAEGPALTDVPSPGGDTEFYAAWASFAEIGELFAHGLVRHCCVEDRDAVALTVLGKTADVQAVVPGCLGAAPVFDDLDEMLTGPAGRRRWAVPAETLREIDAQQRAACPVFDGRGNALDPAHQALRPVTMIFGVEGGR